MRNVLVFKTNSIPENLIALSLFFPSLYFCLANLIKGYLFLYFASFIVGIASYFVLLKKKSVYSLIIPFIVVLTVFYSSLINPGLRSLIIDTATLYDFSKSRIVLLFLVYLPPCFLLITQRIDFKILTKKLFICSMIILPLAIIVNYNRMMSSRILDYMTISYQLLLWTFFALFWTLYNKLRLPWLIIIPAIISIVIGGSRGASICIAITIVLIATFRFFVLGQNEKSAKKVILIFLSIVLVSVALIFFDQILMWIADALNTFGIRSRVVSELITNGFLKNEDRAGLIGQASQHAFDHLLGYGVYGDRFLLNASYTHNFFVELIIDFGVIIGGAIIIYIISISLKSLLICLRNKDEITCYFFIMAIVLVYFKFMVSASYLESAECLMSCGVLYNIYKFSQKDNISNLSNIKEGKKDDTRFLRSSSIVR